MNLMTFLFGERKVKYEYSNRILSKDIFISKMIDSKKAFNTRTKAIKNMTKEEYTQTVGTLYGGVVTVSVVFDMRSLKKE